MLLLNNQPWRRRSDAAGKSLLANLRIGRPTGYDFRVVRVCLQKMQRGIEERLEEMVDPETAGDPQSGRKWRRIDLRKSEALGHWAWAGEPRVSQKRFCADVSGHQRAANSSSRSRSRASPLSRLPWPSGTMPHALGR